MNADGTPSCSLEVDAYHDPGDAWLCSRGVTLDAFICIASFGEDAANAALVVTVTPAPGICRIVTAGRSCGQLLGFTGG
jgi:hypothetical protein